MAPAAQGSGDVVGEYAADVGAGLPQSRWASASSSPARSRGLLRYTQTLTLWRGVDRVDCRTAIDEFTGEDRLLRLRWPCPVPGAMPVSEVGDAVIGRGFGLRIDTGPPTARRHREASRILWTIRHSAGSGCPRRCGSGSARTATCARDHRVAEVVVAGPDADALARELMVALARAGSPRRAPAPDKPRYGDLAVDSNLPDVRISLGGPERQRLHRSRARGATVPN